MRQSDTANTRKTKSIARKKYKERQIEKFLKWCIEQKGYVKYKDVEYIHDKYGVKVY
jgi:NADH:ubiquinone oxidoreductase subunit E